MTILSYLRTLRRARLAARDLRRMTDAQLLDIGIEPGQADAVAAGMAAARKPAPKPDLLQFKAAVFAPVDLPSRRHGFLVRTLRRRQV